jgi:hypothetical protein
MGVDKGRDLSLSYYPTEYPAHNFFLLMTQVIHYSQVILEQSMMLKALSAGKMGYYSLALGTLMLTL